MSRILAPNNCSGIKWSLVFYNVSLKIVFMKKQQTLTFGDYLSG